MRLILCRENKRTINSLKITIMEEKNFDNYENYENYEASEKNVEASDTPDAEASSGTDGTEGEMSIMRYGPRVLLGLDLRQG